MDRFFNLNKVINIGYVSTQFVRFGTTENRCQPRDLFGLNLFCTIEGIRPDKIYLNIKIIEIYHDHKQNCHETITRASPGQSLF